MEGRGRGLLPPELKGGEGEEEGEYNLLLDKGDDPISFLCGGISAEKL